MKRGKKIQRRLERRIADWNATMAMASDGKVSQRKQSGGYKKPGARK